MTDASRSQVAKLLETILSAESVSEAARAHRHVRALSMIANGELVNAANSTTRAGALGSAHQSLRTLLSQKSTTKPAPFASPLARYAVRAAALGVSDSASSGRPSPLASALLSLDRDRFLTAARRLGQRELRWMCGTLDRRSAVRLLSRLGDDGTTRTPAAGWARDVDDACMRLASIDLAAVGCDVAVLLGCSVILALIADADPAIVAALRARMPHAVPAPARIDASSAERDALAIIAEVSS